MDPIKGYTCLQAFMTEERDALFKRIIAERTRYLSVVIEDVYQAHNASAVLRSCDCFGIQDVHVIENQHQWSINEGVSMGAGKWLTVQQYNSGSDNTASTLRSLKDRGYKIVATTPHRDDHIVEDLPLDSPVALVFGAEVRGVSEQAFEMADAFVRIPIHGFTESFNISVAAALCLYELCGRIRREVEHWQLTPEEQTELLLEWARKSVRESDAILKRSGIR